MSTQVEDRVETTPVTKLDDGSERDRFAHIVRKADQMKGYFGGQEVQALCGKVWVPDRDPKRYPVCPTCKEVAEAAGRTVPES